MRSRATRSLPISRSGLNTAIRVVVAAATASHKYCVAQPESGVPEEADGLESENESDSDAEHDEAAQVAKAKAVAASLKANAQAAGR